jgi:RND superfamily putative drug exporter
VSLLSLSVNPDIVVRLIATSLAAGILLDVVVVRTALVPALVAIMGKWNWWLPTGLARLLRICAERYGVLSRARLTTGPVALRQSAGAATPIILR